MIDEIYDLFIIIFEIHLLNTQFRTTFFITNVIVWDKF